MLRAHALLLIDCSGALLVGTSFLLFHRFVHDVSGLSERLILFMGGANLLYGAYSLSLLIPGRATSRAVAMLVAANLCWAAVCGTLAASYGGLASPLGIVWLILEGVFLAVLASLQWRHRRQIVAFGSAGRCVGA